MTYNAHRNYIDKDKLWYWYQHILNCKKLEMGRVYYSKEYGIPIKVFERHYWLIMHKTQSNPAEYEAIIILHKEFLESGLSPESFSKARNLSATKLRHYLNHLRYLKLIDEMIAEGREPLVLLPKSKDLPELQEEVHNLTFRQIATPEPKEITLPEPELEPIQEMAIIPEAPPEPEVIAPQNDIELIITKGVRVLISPSLDSMKIIKIIELLKDL